MGSSPLFFVAGYGSGFNPGLMPRLLMLKRLEIIAELEGFIETRLADLGFELVDINLSGSGSRRVLELYCDRFGEENICVDDCSLISERLKYALQAEGFFEEDFSLTVSSPGLDRVIKHQRDFKRFMGSEVKVILDPSIGGGSVVGKLAGYDKGNIRLTLSEEKEESFSEGQYKSVRLVPDLKGFEGPRKKRAKASKK